MFIYSTQINISFHLRLSATQLTIKNVYGLYLLLICVPLENFITLMESKSVIDLFLAVI